MELYPTDVIAIVAAMAVIFLGGFALYFWFQDKKEERQHKQSNLTHAHK
ncbi:MAG: hypothetical protein N2738_01180 [Thermodesulfovibrionales bacterium]|nr:hypothetical protein [Thermodesulfovibrionales bacterium]